MTVLQLSGLLKPFWSVYSVVCPLFTPNALLFVGARQVAPHDDKQVDTQKSHRMVISAKNMQKTSTEEKPQHTPGMMHRLRLASQHFSVSRELQLTLADSKTVSLRTLRTDIPIDLVDSMWEKKQANLIRQSMEGLDVVKSEVGHPLKGEGTLDAKSLQQRLDLDIRSSNRRTKLAGWSREVNGLLEAGDIPQYEAVKEDIFLEAKLYVEQRGRSQVQLNAIPTTSRQTRASTFESTQTHLHHRHCHMPSQ